MSHEPIMPRTLYSYDDIVHAVDLLQLPHATFPVF
jgi:hypothetical protein